jgi:hypothetical protein
MSAKLTLWLSRPDLRESWRATYLAVLALTLGLLLASAALVGHQRASTRTPVRRSFSKRTVRTCQPSATRAKAPARAASVS